jgi:AcrR family transcriptional regulator
MPALRSDAARSRARILDAARDLPPDELRLNDLARDTGLGVGTVYRHFPTVTALLEALHFDSLTALVHAARAAVDAASAGSAFVELVREVAELQISRDGLQAVLIAPAPSPEVGALREEFARLATLGLDAAIREGRIRPGMTVDQIQRLICGVEHAVRLGDGRDRQLLLDVALAGLAPSRD